MTPRLSGHSSMFSMVFFVLKSPLGVARKFATLTLKARCHVRILIYRTWAIHSPKQSQSAIQRNIVIYEEIPPRGPIPYSFT